MWEGRGEGGEGRGEGGEWRNVNRGILRQRGGGVEKCKYGNFASKVANTWNNIGLYEGEKEVKRANTSTKKNDKE